MAFSAAVQSDYRYRGRSLSDRRPTAGLTIAFDHDSGFYAGGTALAVDTAHRGVRILGYVDYLGYVRRTAFGPSVDVGVTGTKVTYYKFGRHSYHYTEVYAGLLTDHASLRLYYSPSYFGQELKTVYADLNMGAALPAESRVRVFGHLGALTPVGGARYPGSRRERYDMSAGLAARLRSSELSISLTKTTPQAPNPYLRSLETSSVVVGASYFF